jgi:hypothetical protein
VEDLHGDLLTRILLQRRVLEVDVVLEWFAREGNLFVDPFTVFRSQVPVSHAKREEEQDTEEVERPSGLEGQNLGDEPWSDEEDCHELQVGERGTALGGKRGICDGGVFGAEENQIRVDSR